MMRIACGDLSRACASFSPSKPLIERRVLRWTDRSDVACSRGQPDMALTRDPALDRFAGLFRGLAKEVSVRRACACIAHEVGFEFKVREPPEAKATYKRHPKVVARLKTLDRHNHVAPRTGAVYTVFG
jgi:hypothetical protein